jgi:hypothetical protein
VHDGRQAPNGELADGVHPDPRILRVHGEPGDDGHALTGGDQLLDHRVVVEQVDGERDDAGREQLLLDELLLLATP